MLNEKPAAEVHVAAGFSLATLGEYQSISSIRSKSASGYLAAVFKTINRACQSNMRSIKRKAPSVAPVDHQREKKQLSRYFYIDK